MILSAQIGSRESSVGLSYVNSTDSPINHFARSLEKLAAKNFYVL